MGKNIIKSFIIIILILLILLVFFKIFSNNQEGNLQSKTEDEITHFEHGLLDIANKLNNISYANYILTKSDVKDTKQSGNSEGQGENSQKQSDSGSQEKSGDSQKSEASSGGSEQNSQSKSEVTEKYEMERSSILTNKETQIDWDYIKYNAELLDSNWSTMVIDLHSLNVDNNDILNCGDTLNNLIISVKNEDKVKTLQTISDLYSYIPKYTEQYLDDKTKISLQHIKYFVLDTYVLAEEDKWDEMKIQIDNAQNYLSNIINVVDEDMNNQNKINKIYVLLNELDNSINYKDKELFYIKYKTLMENIEKI